MFRQVGIGAAAVLSIGLLAAGCSEDGDNITSGGGSLLQNTDQSPFVGFVNNNLAPDGGGLSPNGVSVGTWEIAFNCDTPDSDGRFSGDNTAMILFTVTDPSGDTRVYATTSTSSGQLTPPVELIGDDRDESKSINLGSYVMLPLNMGNYQSGSTANGTQVNQVRQNSGNWVIVGEYTTFFRTPNLDLAGAHTLTSNNRGERRTIGSWVFLKSLRDQALASSNLVGGVTQSFRYGFQTLGTIIPTSFQGGWVSRNTVSPATTVALADIPACSVTSYGLVTDGFAGETSFSGQALPFTAKVGSAAAINEASAFQTGNSITAFTHAIPRISTASGNLVPDKTTNLVGLNSSRYRPGEDVSSVVAVWTQVASSVSGGGTNNDADDTTGGHELQLRYRTLNLATLTWEADEAEVPFAAEANARTGNLRAGTAPFTDLRGYNNQLFFKYADASLITNSGTTIINQNLLAMSPTETTNQTWVQRETRGHRGGPLLETANNRTFWREVIGMVRFKDDGDGTASLAGTAVDVSSDASTRASAGVHSTTMITVTPGTRNVYPATGREMANFNGFDSGWTNRSIIGPDEGMSDISLFYVMADNTNSTANGGDSNIDNKGYVVGIVAGTTDVAAASIFQVGTNPTVFSGTHQADFHQVGDVGNFSQLQDPVLIRNVGSVFNENGLAGNGNNAANPTVSLTSEAVYFDLVLNRTGQYAAIMFAKDTGVSARVLGGTGGFSQDLHTTIYQTFRPAATTTQSSAVGTPANMQNRFPTAGPNKVNGTETITQMTYQNNAQNVATAETSRHWNSRPVNAYSWQSCLGYRVGIQSNNLKMSAVYEQSDSTDDGIFLFQNTVVLGAGNPAAAPTLTTGTAVQLEGTADVGQVRPLINVTSNSSVRNIDTTAKVWAHVNLLEAGLTAAGGTGEVLVYYERIADHTTTDGDFADQELMVTRFTGTSVGTSFPIGNNVNENAPIIGANGNSLRTLAGITNTDDATQSRINAISWVHTGTRFLKINCVAPNTNITSSPNYPVANGAFSHYVYLGGVEVALTTTSTGTTTITGNASGKVNLLTRKYNAVPTTALVTFETRFDPDIATATFKQPKRLDHEAGIADDVGVNGTATENIQCCASGTSVGIIFESNNQLWFQGTSDGVNYLAQGGLANPLLVTNLSSQDVVSWDVDCCLDSNQDTISAMLTFTKQDVDNDVRLFNGSGSIR